MRFFAFAFVLLSVAGCAGGMSKDECLYADWRAIGFEDGSNGYTAGAASSKRQACAKKAGVTLDMQSYLAGRQAGLREYCRPANGFSVGARGVRYNGVCAGFDEPRFVDAYRNGEHLYALTSAAAHSDRLLRNAEAELDAIIDRIAFVEAALVSPATPHLQRVDYLVERKQLAEEQERIEYELVDLARDRDYEAAEVEAYRNQLSVEGAYEGVVTPRAASY